MHTTHSTLSALVERSLAGNLRPLEFYLREQSRLPGTRANLELVKYSGRVRRALRGCRLWRVRCCPIKVA